MTCQTIQQVIDELTVIVENSKKEKTTHGYFALLYRMVTMRIRDGIAANDFEDNARMEKLDVLFANRYLDAYHKESAGKKPSKSWTAAFEKTKKKDGLILQHLLLGINAHINLDLGIAAAETVGTGDLQKLKKDFNDINAILSDMVDDVQNRISKVSPLFRLFDPLAGRVDEKLANFSIGLARDGAWQFAVNYHKAQNKQQCIGMRDEIIALLGAQIANPKSRWLRSVVATIRFFENKNPEKVMQALEN
jgi:hypothetical protein